MGKFVIPLFFQSICDFLFAFILHFLHGDLLLSSAQRIYLDLSDIFTRFQMAILDFDLRLFFFSMWSTHCDLNSVLVRKLCHGF